MTSDRGWYPGRVKGPAHTRQFSALDSCEPGCETDGDTCEMKQALLYLDSQTERYAGFVPPLTPMTKQESPKRYITVTFRMGRIKRRSTGTIFTSIDVASDSGDSTTGVATDSELYSFLRDTVFTREVSGSLVVTTGLARRVLDVFLEQFGERLCEDGYELEPRISGTSINQIRVTKRGGKSSWTLVYAETMTGVKVSTLLGYARDAGYPVGSGRLVGARILSGAIAAYADLISRTFGIALSPTAGMIASKAVRSFLPEGFKKWRPDPLLVAFERVGHGYRGGMTYAQRYRGPSVRIDVNRQYTHALTAPLPYRAVFGRYVSETETPHGVFLCRVRFNNPCPYPLGIWDAKGKRFRVGNKWIGTHVCVLHTTEFAGLRAFGADITPWYGWIFTRVFDLSGYVECLQSLLDTHGYDSHLSKILKPLGNYVYGKFGQNPWQKSLKFAKHHPGKGWHAYLDEDMRDWEMVWEKETRRVTSSQHAEIAGTITGHARAMTLLMWHRCVTSGLIVVRCHTDSLTVAAASLPPTIAASLEAGRIGGWRVESSTADTVIIGTNAYVDEHGAHIAGVIDPTWEMVERIYDGHVVYVTQTERTPLAGFARGVRENRKRLSG